MSLDKFGRYSLDSSTSSKVDFKDSTSKIYIDNCLERTTKSIEDQLNSLIAYQNQLHEIYKNQTNSNIKILETQLKEIDLFVNQTNLSIFKLEKESTAFNIDTKKNNKTLKVLEDKVHDLDTRMRLKRF